MQALPGGPVQHRLLEAIHSFATPECPGPPEAVGVMSLPGFLASGLLFWSPGLSGREFFHFGSACT